VAQILNNIDSGHKYLVAGYLLRTEKSTMGDLSFCRTHIMWDENLDVYGHSIRRPFGPYTTIKRITEGLGGATLIPLEGSRISVAQIPSLPN
jgi:hypothetical protein